MQLTTARRSRAPLTDEQRDLVGPYYPAAIQFSTRAAYRFHARKCGVEPEDIAGEALLRLAQSMSPDRDADALLNRCVTLAAIDLVRQATRWRMEKKKPIPGVIPFDEIGESFEAEIASNDDPIGWEAESEDEVRKLSRGLTPQEASLIRFHYLRADCHSLRGSGRRFGYSESRASQLRSSALTRLRSLRSKGGAA